MAEITLNLNAPLNQSLQAGDTVYYVTTTTQAEFDVNNTPMVKIGKIKSITLTDSNGDGIINNAALLCDIGNNTIPPEIGDFLFFEKDRRVNEVSILGYYGEIKFTNNSKRNAELFMVGCEVTSNS
tara:strand:- start:1866 stop:2243 length:378 start_codon:yes stop_codon:yes gene_type:complete